MTNTKLDLPGSESLMDPRLREQMFYVEASGRVKRWHTEPVLHQQTVGEHSYGVVYLCLLITSWAASRQLLLAALLHDTAERKFGDIPGPTKRRLNDKAQLDAMEDAHLKELGINIPELTAHEARVLKLADLLEGALFCAFEVRRGNREIVKSFRNYLNYIASMGPDGVVMDIYNELAKEYTRVFG